MHAELTHKIKMQKLCVLCVIGVSAARSASNGTYLVPSGRALFIRAKGSIRNTVRT